MKNKILIIFSIIYLLVTTTRLTSFWLIDVDSLNSANVEEVVDPISVVLKAISGLYLCWYIITKKDKFITYLFSNVPLILFLLFTFTSCFWSEEIFSSLRKYITAIFLGVLTIAVYCSDDPEKRMRQIIMFYGIIALVISLLLIIIMPQAAIMKYEGMLLPTGIYAHKNTLGQVCMFLIVFLVSTYKQLDKKETFIFLITITLSIVLLIACKSASSLVTMVVAVSSYFLYKRNRLIKVSVLLLLITTILLIFIIVPVIYNTDNVVSFIFSSFLNLLGKDSTLTGRTDLWQSILYLGIKNHPWFGAGFKSFFSSGNMGIVSMYAGWSVRHAHNSFISTFLDLGIIGLVSYIIVLIYLYIKIRNIQEILGCFIAYLLLSLTEDPLLRYTYGGFMFFVFFFYSSLSRVKGNN